MQKSSSWTQNVLVQRFLFTVIALLVFRLGVHIPIPGVDAKELSSFADQQNAGLLKIFNVFSGGALSHFSVLSLAVMPYISSSIIVQLLSVVVPAFEQLQKEGGVGRQKLTRMTRGFTVILAFIQGYLLASGLEAARGLSGGAIVIEPGLFFRVLSAVLMCAGSVFVMWIGEQITERGIGNGISLVIFAGIVAYLPPALGQFANMIRENSGVVLGLFGLLIFVLLAVFLVVFIEQSYRKVPIHHAKRIVGQKVMSTQASHLPIKVNMSGIMAAIFTSTILAVPATFFSFKKNISSQLVSDFLPGHWLYNVSFALLGLFFSFFYASIIFKPDDIAENLKKQNAYIPGIRPGSETSLALDSVMTRLTLVGAFYMIFVVTVPTLVMGHFTQQMNLGGTSLLIVVGVALDAMRQVTAQLATQSYDSLFLSEEGREK